MWVIGRCDRCQHYGLAWMDDGQNQLCARCKGNADMYYHLTCSNCGKASLCSIWGDALGEFPVCYDCECEYAGEK